MGKLKRLIKIFGIPAFLSSFMFIFACTFRPFEYHEVKFNSNVCIEPYSAYTYRVACPLRVTIDGEPFEVPNNFETDLASIPRWYWMILAPQYSAFVAPSILHDYFYRCANLKTRKYADEVFYYALLQQGVTTYTASKFYLAVRLFGAHSYSKSLPCLPNLHQFLPKVDNDGYVEAKTDRPRGLAPISVQMSV